MSGGNAYILESFTEIQEDLDKNELAEDLHVTVTKSVSVYVRFFVVFPDTETMETWKTSWKIKTFETYLTA